VYNKTTLEKFNKNKTMKYFPGVSIVNNFNGTTIMPLLAVWKQKLLSCSFSNKLVFLPEDSYHMTVADIVTYNNLDKTKSHLFNKREINAMDVKIISLISDINRELNVELTAEYFTQTAIYLKPKSAEDYNILNTFRKNIFDRLGFPHDPDYRFHISISYMLEELDDTELHELEILRKSYTKDLYENLKSIAIIKPELTLFNDMSEFRSYEQGRKNLGFFESE
jgi:hypothetical protein